MIDKETIKRGTKRQRQKGTKETKKSGWGENRGISYS